MIKTKPTEDQLCTSFYKQVLQLQAWNQFDFKFKLIHVPNESHTSAGYRMKLARMGVVAGVSDYIVFYQGGRSAAIEFKRDAKSRYSPHQISFKQECLELGMPYLGTYSIEEAIDFIRSLNK